MQDGYYFCHSRSNYVKRLYFCLIFDQEIKFLTTWLNYLFPFRQRTVSAKQWSVYNLKTFWNIFLIWFCCGILIYFLTNETKRMPDSADLNEHVLIWSRLFVGVIFLWPWVQNLGRTLSCMNSDQGLVLGQQSSPHSTMANRDYHTYEGTRSDNMYSR